MEYVKDRIEYENMKHRAKFLGLIVIDSKLIGTLVITGFTTLVGLSIEYFLEKA